MYLYLADSDRFRVKMTDKLPPNLLQLFAPRPPLRYLIPSDHAPEVRHTAPVSGVAQYLPALEEYKKTDVYKPTESWLQRHDRIKLEKKEHRADLINGASTLCEQCLNLRLKSMKSD